jgi:hypothetical protein
MNVMRQADRVCHKVDDSGEATKCGRVLGDGDIKTEDVPTRLRWTSFRKCVPCFFVPLEKLETD